MPTLIHLNRRVRCSATVLLLAALLSACGLTTRADLGASRSATSSASAVAIPTILLPSPLPASATVSSLLPTTDGSIAPTPPIDIRLEPSTVGALHQTVQFVATITSTITFTNTTVAFRLPSQVVLIHGQINQQTTLVAHQPQQFALEIRLDTVGTYPIAVTASAVVPAGQVGRADVVYLIVSAEKTDVTRASPQ